MGAGGVIKKESSEVWVSIDLGTHTARMLVCRKSVTSALLETFFRKASYLHLANDLKCPEDEKILGEAALDRAVGSLKDFLESLRPYKISRLYAVGTGVIREAANKEIFLNQLFEQTGISVRPISAWEETLLTLRGIEYGLSLNVDKFFVFDIGGGSSEFLVGSEEALDFCSLHLGALTLTKRFLWSDPPMDQEIKRLERYIYETLKRELIPIRKEENVPLAVGTGGSVVTIACVIYKVPFSLAGSDEVNGLVLTREQISTFFKTVKDLSIEHRMEVAGLDRGRADVIVAGSMLILKVMEIMGLEDLKVSLSDLLEGLLIQNYLEEKHEWM